jgi:hypothetical protein
MLGRVESHLSTLQISPRLVGLIPEVALQRSAEFESARQNMYVEKRNIVDSNCGNCHDCRHWLIIG